MAGSLKTIVRNSAFIATGLVLGNISSLLFRLVIARTYGPRSFGVFSIGFMLVSVTTTFAIFGLPAGVTRYVSHYRSIDKEQRIPLVLGISLGISLILSALLTFVLVIWGQPLAKHVLHSPATAKFIRWFAFQIPANTLILLTAAFALGHERGGMQVAIKDIIPKLLIITFTIALIAIGGTIFDVGLGYVIARWVAALIGVTAAARLLKFSNITKFSVAELTDEVRELLFYSSPLLFTTFTGFLLNWVDTFFVAFYLSDSKVGIYQTAFILGHSLSLFFSAVSESLFPNFSSLLGDGNIIKVSQRYAEGVQWVSIMTAAPFFYLMTFPHVSLKMLFGPGFGLAGTPLMIILIGQFITVIFGPTGGLLKSTGNTRSIFVTYLVAALVNLIGNIFLIPRLGLIGAAVSTSTAVFIQSLFKFVISKSIIDVNLPLQEILQVIVAGGFTAIIFSIAFPKIYSPTEFALSIIAFSVVNLLSLIFVGLIGYEEIEMTLELMR